MSKRTVLPSFTQPTCRDADPDGSLAAVGFNPDRHKFVKYFYHKKHIKN
jgi:hypothetical protein